MQRRVFVRTLVVALAVIGAVFALWVRFGPHVLWKTVGYKVSSGVEPVPSTPLADVPADGDWATCQVGPISFELPSSMSTTVDVQRGVGGMFLVFHDDNRVLGLQLPRRDDGLLQQQLTEFPKKAKCTFPRLYKEICDAKSSDFSFGMSRQQLRWHRWLLMQRSLISTKLSSIEYRWDSRLEGVLTCFDSSYTFQWGTIDRKWEGTITFKPGASSNHAWIRHACATFAINGDPAVFDNLDEETIRSMVKFTNRDHANRQQSSPD